MQRHAIQIPISYYIWDWKILIINFYFFSRIVRNKAAERAKGSSSGPGSNSICGASSPVSQTISAASVGMTQSSMVLDNRPSYSINGILGIPQQDANANINKRKREDEGMTKLERLLHRNINLLPYMSPPCYPLRSSFLWQANKVEHFNTKSSQYAMKALWTTSITLF